METEVSVNGKNITADNPWQDSDQRVEVSYKGNRTTVLATPPFTITTRKGFYLQDWTLGQVRMVAKGSGKLDLVL